MSKETVRSIRVREGSPALSWNSADWPGWLKGVGFAAIVAALTSATQVISQHIEATDFGPGWSWIVVTAWGAVLKAINTWLFPQPPTPAE